MTKLVNKYLPLAEVNKNLTTIILGLEQQLQFWDKYARQIKKRNKIYKWKI